MNTAKGMCALPFAAVLAGLPTLALAEVTENRAETIPRTPLTAQGEARAEGVVTAPTAMELLAFQGDSKATLQISETRSWARSEHRDGESVTGARFDTWSLKVSTPLQKGSDSAQLASLDGLASAISLEVKFSQTVAVRPLRGAEVLKFCEDHAVANCDAGAIAAQRPDLAPAFYDLLWGPKPSSTTWGVSGAIGSEEFSYVDPTTLAKQSDDKTSWSGRIYLAGFWTDPSEPGVDAPGRGRENLFVMSYSRQSTWKSRDEAILCPPGGGVVTCTKGPPGPPRKTEKDLFSVQYRRGMGSWAFSVNATYDARNNVFGIETPVYLIRDGAGGLTGGVVAGWRDDTDEITFGVFVSKAFNLIDF